MYTQKPPARSKSYKKYEIQKHTEKPKTSTGKYLMRHVNKKDKKSKKDR